MAGTNPTTHIESSDWEPAFTFPGAGTPSRPQPPQSGGSSIIPNSLQFARSWHLTYRVKTRSDRHVTPFTRFVYVIQGLSGRANLSPHFSQPIQCRAVAARVRAPHWAANCEKCGLAITASDSRSRPAAG